METKKLSQEELQQIDTIQQKNQLVIQELGHIQVIKLQLTKREQIAQQYLEEIEQEQEQIAQQLESVYGKGSINLETGEFTTSE